MNFSEVCGLDALGSGQEPVARLCVNDNEFLGSIKSKNLSCNRKSLMFEE